MPIAPRRQYSRPPLAPTAITAIHSGIDKYSLALCLSDLCPCRSGKRGATCHKAAPERKTT
ncbi:hypothetical protein EWJ91_03230 [Salmonella enterica subsp. enterica serovar Ouagadougou]|nr:hypothetical protein [Salmonella enterica subsp. enterica serovar Ouagadougou]ECE8975505.1 hypothetical protein [Salmonella enterica subsp. enterica serovar Ouagadougou]ECE9170086.1 hypothetical protein [Salmonella enterica subsp. enterica serovar Ouagadougou]ECG3009145.1 hypothetical protein [Salmonella enterica subsp. enterica serovar Ouagadougou]